jgi:hypothetical protein
MAWLWEALTADAARTDSTRSGQPVFIVKTVKNVLEDTIPMVIH